jgi:hypothetical protein
MTAGPRGASTPRRGYFFQEEDPGRAEADLPGRPGAQAQ